MVPLQPFSLGGWKIVAPVQKMHSTSSRLLFGLNEAGVFPDNTKGALVLGPFYYVDAVSLPSQSRHKLKHCLSEDIRDS